MLLAGSLLRGNLPKRLVVSPLLPYFVYSASMHRSFPASLLSAASLPFATSRPPSSLFPSLAALLLCALAASRCCRVATSFLGASLFRLHVAGLLGCGASDLLGCPAPSPFCCVTPSLRHCFAASLRLAWLRTCNPAAVLALLPSFPAPCFVAQ